MTTDTTRARMFTIRRAVPALGLWSGDVVRRTDDGGLELIRTLPPGAEAVLRRAELRGDVDIERGDR